MRFRLSGLAVGVVWVAGLALVRCAVDATPNAASARLRRAPSLELVPTLELSPAPELAAWDAGPASRIEPRSDAGPENDAELEARFCGPLVQALVAARERCGCPRGDADASTVLFELCREDLVHRPRPPGQLAQWQLDCCFRALAIELDDCGPPRVPMDCNRLTASETEDAVCYEGVVARCEADPICEDPGCQFDGDCGPDHYCRGDDEGTCTPDREVEIDGVLPICQLRIERVF